MDGKRIQMDIDTCWNQYGPGYGLGLGQTCWNRSSIRGLRPQAKTVGRHRRSTTSSNVFDSSTLPGLLFKVDVCIFYEKRYIAHSGISMLDMII